MSQKTQDPKHRPRRQHVYLRYIQLFACGFLFGFVNILVSCRAPVWHWLENWPNTCHNATVLVLLALALLPRGRNKLYIFGRIINTPLNSAAFTRGRRTPFNTTRRIL